MYDVTSIRSSSPPPPSPSPSPSAEQPSSRNTKILQSSGQGNTGVPLVTTSATDAQQKITTGNFGENVQSVTGDVTLPESDQDAGLPEELTGTNGSATKPSKPKTLVQEGPQALGGGFQSATVGVRSAAQSA